MLKRLLDITGATLGLVVLGVPMLVAALLIKLDSPGPVLFVQGRLGRDLKPFRMLKFRTMVDKAEQIGTGLFSYADDNRVTRIGKILRATSFDELPQLLNVLGGSMSLVGPRPPVTYELGDIGMFTDFMRVRFQVKPGITGLAQISGRNDLEWPEKMVFDNQYVEQYARWGVLVDLRILLATVWVVLAARNVIEPKRDAADR
jgi:lipopolysaccharide/colanic/teichoic acid biosynthesis glycosyltransferase